MADLQPARLELRVQAEPGTDADRIDRETRQLRAELRDLDVGSVELGTEAAPPGAKAGDAFTLGLLLVEVAPAAISSLIGFLTSWTLRRKGRTMRIKTVLKDRSIEMDFDPATTSPDEVKTMVSSILKELERTKG